jgi:PhoPQ-activated pathogenicity-related protein
VWWHFVVVIIPDELIISDKAIMYITGGNQEDHPPKWEGDEDIELVITLVSKCKGGFSPFNAL